MDEQAIRNVISSVKGAQILVASKYIDAEQIRLLKGIGLTIFGENRVDALLQKVEALKGEMGISFHFIGHLQSNKAKLVANKIDCLHSLDSLKTARLLDEALEKPLDCYIELHLTDNALKSGVNEEDLPAFLEGLKTYQKIHPIGFMAMTDADMDETSKRAVFHKAKALAERYGLAQLSMGMSDDYEIALKEGATIVRLGRIITNHC